MTDASVSRLAQARIIPPIEAALFPSPSEAMRDLVAVGASHLARTRFWHFGGVKQEPNHIVARLGYETKEETDLYDDAAKDFRHGAVPAAGPSSSSSGLQTSLLSTPAGAQA